MTEMADKASPDTHALWQVISATKLGFEPALTIPDRLVHPDSWAGHLPFASWIVAMTQPRRIVELGVHTGNSFCTFAQAVEKYKLEADCFGIDHWFGDEQAGLYGEDVYTDLKAWHDPRFGHFSKMLRMSFLDGRSYIEDGSVDLLHIDGLHTYEAVREDFETWVPKMSDRCVVLFHDTNVFQEGFGVHEYFKEIKAKYPTFEFLHSNGLGVAYTGTRPLETLDPIYAALFSASQDDRAATLVRSYFSRIGDANIKAVQVGDVRRWGEDILERLNGVNQELAGIVEDREKILKGQVAALDEVERLQGERQLLLEKAVKWDQLAVNMGEAANVQLEDVNKALNVLFNSGNPQALRDRDVLKSQLSELVVSGTIEPGTARIAQKLKSAVRHRLSRFVQRAPQTQEDPAITAIRKSGLFDEAQYALTSDARAAGQDPLEHYLQVGEEQRIAPSSKFDPEYYARYNPDVAASGFGLLRHYVLFGLAEERRCITPAKRMPLPDLSASTRARILFLVEPDLPPTDRAFALDTASRLAETHDVVLFMQAGDPQATEFEKTAVGTVYFPDEFDIEAIDRNEVLDLIVKTVQAEFGVALSIRSRINVRGLAAAGLGIVQFVDEFSSSIHPMGTAYQFLAWAHRLVFPSKAVAGSFEAEHPYLARRQMDVLLPPALQHAATPAAEAARQRLRPAGKEDALLVLGYGPLSPESGVDTFIALAAKTGATSTAGKPLRFVWATRDAAGPKATEHARLITEQIRWAGVSGHCEIMTIDADADAVLPAADIVAATAPIDAMSQTAISAVSLGKPVVCFKGSSTIADVLESNPDTAPLVSGYLDINALAGSVQRLCDDEGHYEKITAACRNLGSETLDPAAFVYRLIEIGKQAQADAKLIVADRDVIRAANPPAFNEDLFGGVWSADDYPQDYLHTYLLRGRVSRSASKIAPPDLRRPLSGFNPSIYFEDAVEQGSLADPLALWIEAGRPEGRWTHSVIDLPSAKPVETGVSALLHGHFYYVDLIDEFLEMLKANSSKIDLILTVPNEKKAEIARQSLGRIGHNGSAIVEISPNAGRDIGPFLSGLDKDLLAKYEVIGHIHGKKSPHIDAASGSSWRTFLWEHVIGGETPAADACLAAFEADKTLGLIFPEDPHLVAWDANFEMGTDLAKRMGRTEPLPKAFEWPIGTMFWARRAALEPLFSLGLDWDDYPHEPLPEDGTLLHALERVMPFAVEQAGFGYTVTHNPKVQR